MSKRRRSELETIQVTLPLTPSLSAVVAAMQQAAADADTAVATCGEMEHFADDAYTAAAPDWRRVARLYRAAAARLGNVFPLAPPADAEAGDAAV